MAATRAHGWPTLHRRQRLDVDYHRQASGTHAPPRAVGTGIVGSGSVSGSAICRPELATSHQRGQTSQVVGVPPLEAEGLAIIVTPCGC